MDLNLFTPQWQGSGLTRELYDGACALKNYFNKTFSLDMVETAVETGSPSEIKNGILGYREILSQLLRLQDVLAERRPGTTFTLGGGCGIEIPLVSWHLRKDRDLALFWFDAHGDLNSPATSQSHHFHGMPLRFLTDDLFLHPGLSIERADPSKVVLSGARDLDPPELDYIAAHKIKVLGPDSFPLGNALQMNQMPRARRAYIHIDLDVLDPGEFRNVKCPVHRGICADDLASSIRMIRKNYEIAGISILENTELEEDNIASLSGLWNECMS